MEECVGCGAMIPVGMNGVCRDCGQHEYDTGDVSDEKVSRSEKVSDQETDLIDSLDLGGEGG